MNRWQVGGIFVATGMGILAGVALAWGEATSTSEIRARNKYDENLESVKRALELTRQPVHVEEPAATEFELTPEDHQALREAASEEEIKVGGEIVVESAIAPDYIAQAVNYSSPDSFIRPENDFGMSYVEPEEYHEEDGRPKEQVTILMGGGGDDPLFFMDGEQIDNWGELIGDQILVDFYKMCPPGTETVLYVRNHKMDTDFEVIMEMPA